MGGFIQKGIDARFSSAQKIWCGDMLNTPPHVGSLFSGSHPSQLGPLFSEAHVKTTPQWYLTLFYLDFRDSILASQIKTLGFSIHGPNLGSIVVQTFMCWVLYKKGSTQLVVQPSM